MAGNPLASLPGLPQRPSLARSSASETRLTQPGIEAARSRKLNSAPTAAFRFKCPIQDFLLGFCPTCGRGGQVRAVWREAVHAVHRLAAKRTYATNSFLAFAPWFGVPSEWKRAISRGPWNRAMAPFQYSSTRMVLLAK